MKNRRYMIVTLVLVALVVVPLVFRADGVYEFGPGKAGASPQQPQLAVAPDGSIYLAYGSENSIYCAVSREGGKSFSPPVLVGNEGPLSLGMHRGPRVAATENFVVITAVAGKQGKGRDGNLLAWRSGDQGKTWSKSVIVNDAVDSPREGLHAHGSRTA